MKPESRPQLFISDLHLAEAEAATTARFLGWLAEVAPAAGAVYILGDLFEAWPGDDCLAEPWPAGLARALHRLGDTGTRLHLLHGNRDFLLGQAFCQAAGTDLLAEPSVIDLAGRPAVLLHGDSLCTDDLAYQQFRHQVRDPAWQQAVLARPLAERQALARQLRAESESAKADKQAAIMDVNAEAVAAAFRQSGSRVMIHGHTHRPARHDLTVDGQACTRWVLPDWCDGRGGYLRCDGAGCELLDY